MTTTDKLLALAQTAGDLLARIEQIEKRYESQALPLEAATKALAASLDGLRSLDVAALESRLVALENRLNSASQ